MPPTPPERAAAALARLTRDTYAHDPEQAAVEGGYGLPAARAQAAELLSTGDPVGLTALAASRLDEPEVVEGEVLDPVDPHGVKADDRGAIVLLTCRCGQWEAAAGGPSSLAWAGRSHRQHVREAERAAAGR